MAKNRKEELLDAAIRSYAENGDRGLTTKNLAKAAGCSEALIYRYFKSREDLLASCYLRLHAKVNNLCDRSVLEENSPMKDFIDIAMGCWDKLFSFFIAAGYESVFYFDYRTSPEFMEMKNTNPEVADTYSSSFMNTFEKLREKYNLGIPSELYRVFLVNVMGAFVTAVVKGELPDNEETHRNVQGLVFSGMISSLPGFNIKDHI